MDEQTLSKQLAIAIGKQARAARTALKMTQAQVAEEIDVTTEFYARMERGTSMPSAETLYRMAVVLDIPVDLMIGPVVVELQKERDQHLPPAIRYIVEQVRKHPRMARVIISLMNFLEEKKPKEKK